MTAAAQTVVTRLWNYYQLRDDGMPYGDDGQQLIIRICYPYCSLDASNFNNGGRNDTNV
jgi:hypothetical protein